MRQRGPSLIHRNFCLVLALAALGTASAGCDKDKPKAEEDKKVEPTPVPSGLVFNDWVNGETAQRLGVRDSGLEGGLAAVGGGGGEPGEPNGPAGSPGDEKLKVVEPGAEPRASRKYTFVANRTDKRILTITQSVTQSMGGQTAPGQELTLKLFLDLTPKAVKPTGSTIEAKLTKIDLPGAPPQAAGMLASMNGLTGTFDVNPRGIAGEVSFTANQQMKNQLAESVVQGLNQAVQLLLAPFPDAPIGVGAKWELGATARPDAPEQGTKRFTLKELTAEGGVIDADIDVKVPRRAAQGPRGGTMFVEVDGKGHYTYNFRFDRTATHVEGELTVNEKIEVPEQKGGPQGGGGGKQQMMQTQKVKQVIDSPK